MFKSLRSFSSDEIYVGLFYLIGLLLPHTFMVFQLANPLMCLFLYNRARKNPNNKKVGAIKFLLIASLLLSFVLNISAVEGDTKVLIAFIYLILLLFCFPFVGDVKIRKEFSFFALGYILLSQLVFVFGITPAIRIIDIVYPVLEVFEHHIGYITNNVSAENMFDFRLGGIYRNSNNLCRFINIISVVYLLENKKSKMSEYIIFALLSFGSILMAGSRTGLMIQVCVFYFALFRHNNLIPKSYKTMLYLLVAGGFIFLLTRDISFRVFEIQEGLNGSANEKWETFISYITSSSTDFGQLMFGNINVHNYIAAADQLGHFDSEYGSFIFKYGFVGFACYMLFWIQIYRKTPSKYRAIYFILLWMVSSTVMMAYRSAFVVMLVYSRFINKKQNE